MLIIYVIKVLAIQLLQNTILFHRWSVTYRSFPTLTRGLIVLSNPAIIIAASVARGLSIRKKTTLVDRPKTPTAEEVLLVFIFMVFSLLLLCCSLPFHDVCFHFSFSDHVTFLTLILISI